MRTRGGMSGSAHTTQCHPGAARACTSRTRDPGEVGRRPFRSTVSATRSTLGHAPTERSRNVSSICWMRAEHGSAKTGRGKERPPPVMPDACRRSRRAIRYLADRSVACGKIPDSPHSRSGFREDGWRLALRAFHALGRDDVGAGEAAAASSPCHPVSGYPGPRGHADNASPAVVSFRHFVFNDRKVQIGACDDQ